MLKNLFPSLRQWRSWSLPSKASYFSAVLAVLTILIGSASFLLELSLLRKFQAIVEPPPSFANADGSLIAAIRGEVEEKLEKDLRNYNHPSYFIGLELINNCKDPNHWDEDLQVGDLFLMRSYALHSQPDDFYARDELFRFREQPLEVANIVFETVDLGRYFEGLQFFLYYREQIEKNTDFRERLEKAYLILSEKEKSAFVGGNQAVFNRAKAALEIAPYPSGCLHIRKSGPSLEDWVVSFWIRRHQEGNYLLFSWLLDQALQNSTNYTGHLRPLPLSDLTMKNFSWGQGPYLGK